MEKPFHHLARGIIIDEGKVLLAHAKGHKNTFLPGGHIEFGESAKDALIREIKEEIGVDCEVESFLGLVKHKWEKNGVVHVEVNQVFKVTSSDLQSSKCPIAREPHLEFVWADTTEIDQKELQPYPFRKLIQELLDGKKPIWWESTLNKEIDANNRNG